MKIGFVGAGKVGTSFGIYLKQNGFRVYGYNSRTMESAQKAAMITKSVVVHDIEEIFEKADVAFITTSDYAIAEVVETIIDTNVTLTGKKIAHMSGAHSSSVLSALKEKGAYIYSIHPLQAFASVEQSVQDLKNTVFSIEGDTEGDNTLEKILSKMGNEYFTITAKQKSLYHAAACILSNYLVTLMDYGLSLYEQIGIDKEKMCTALAPLLKGTLNNVLELGTEKALTGPIDRGDINTVDMHLQALEQYAPKEVQLYQILGLKTLKLAAKSKEYPQKKALYKLLKEGVGDDKK